jgi:hypothetical protein
VEGQKKSQLGKNMKSRIPASNVVEPETVEQDETDETAGQTAISQVADSYRTEDSPETGSVPDQSGTTLETEDSQKARQEAVVAETNDLTSKMGEFMAPPEDANQPADRLRDLMQKSRQVEPVIQTAPVGVVLPTAEEIEAITAGSQIPPLMHLDTKTGKIDVVVEGVGPQPSGDYGVLVTVPEQLVSGVLGQAELDGVSPSEWLNVRVGEYLSQWFFGR